MVVEESPTLVGSSANSHAMPSPNIGNEATAVVLANSTTTNTTAPYPMHLTPEEMKELSMVDGYVLFVY